MNSDVALSPDPERNVSARPLSTRRWIIGAVALTFIGATLSYGYSAFIGAPAAPTKGLGRAPLPRVAAAEIAKGDFPVVLSGLGTVTPSATAIVKTQIAGQLVEVSFTEAQPVKVGDALAHVDPRPYQLALAQAEGQLQKDVALLQNAERDLMRYETLNKKMKDVISGQQIDTQRALINQYKGTVAIDRALVDQARLNLSYCRIISPIEGRIGLRQVDQGNYVQPNDPNGIAVVTRLSPITVIFTLPENRLPPVLKKFRAGEKLTVVAFDHERAVELARGRLAAIDNQIDSSSGTVKLRAEFANEDERLFPNQFVNAELLVETLRDVALAPAAAVQQGAQGPFVYLIRPDSTVAARAVKLGPASGERVVIEDGLKVGERVVVEGADKLREGMIVSLPSVEPREQAPARQRPSAKNGAS